LHPTERTLRLIVCTGKINIKCRKGNDPEEKEKGKGAHKRGGREDFLSTNKYGGSTPMRKTDECVKFLQCAPKGKTDVSRAGRGKGAYARIGGVPETGNCSVAKRKGSLLKVQKELNAADRRRSAVERGGDTTAGRSSQTKRRERGRVFYSGKEANPRLKQKGRLLDLRRMRS